MLTTILPADAVDEHFLPGIQAPASDAGGPNSFTNVDGFGIGWFSSVPGRYRIHDTPHEQHPQAPLEPVVYRNILPPIHDLNLHSLANAVESSTVFGHVRAVRRPSRSPRLSSERTDADSPLADGRVARRPP